MKRIEEQGDVPIDGADAQQLLLGQMLALQTDWMGQLICIQAAWLGLFFPWLKDPTGYLPAWMINHDGMEHLG